MDKLAMAIIVFLVAALLFVGPVYLIWNYALVKATTWAREVGFWEALGIAFLISMLRPSSSGNRSATRNSSAAE